MLNRVELKDLPQLITPHELAETLGISLPFCYKLIRTKGFPSFRVGKKWLISTDRLMEWIANQTNEADNNGCQNLVNSGADKQ